MLPEVQDVARADRVSINASGPASLPAYTTISGTTRIVPAGGGASAPLAGVLVDAFSTSGRGSDDLYGSGGEYSARTYSTADGTWSMKVPPGSWALRYRTQFGEPFYPGGGAGPATLSSAKASTGSGGAVTLTVSVSGPGAVTATATVAAPKGGARKSAAKPVTVAKAAARAKKAGPVKLVLGLTKAGKKLLRQRGKLTAKTAIVFKPTAGAAATTTKSVTFKKPRPKKRPRR